MNRARQFALDCSLVIALQSGNPHTSYLPGMEGLDLAVALDRRLLPELQSGLESHVHETRCHGSARPSAIAVGGPTRTSGNARYDG